MSLRHAILGFLSLRPMSGYDLKRAFDTSVRHFWTADQAAIYRALSDLESGGLVAHERIAQTARPDRKEFALTAEGRTEFERWLAAPMPTAPRREPLLVKLFFAGQLEPPVTEAIVEAERAQITEELGALLAYVAGVEQRAAALPVSERQALLGPLITLTNGLQLGLTYHAWLTRLATAAQQGTLTVDALLADLRQLTATLPKPGSPSTDAPDSQ
jgi:DNA-binding PadR family transcriptional regulator